MENFELSEEKYVGLLEDLAERINAGTAVAEYLFDCFKGDKPLPNKEVCLMLVKKLTQFNA